MANFSYDTSGNLVRDGENRTFGYDADNHQTSFNGAAGQYSYDGEGRRVKRVAGAVSTVYVYNALGTAVFRGGIQALGFLGPLKQPAGAKLGQMIGRFAKIGGTGGVRDS